MTLEQRDNTGHVVQTHMTKREQKLCASKHHGTPLNNPSYWRDLRHLPFASQMRICTAFVNGLIDIHELQRVAHRKRVMGNIRKEFQAVVQKQQKHSTFETWQDVVDAYPVATQDSCLMQWIDTFDVCNLNSVNLLTLSHI